MFFQQKQQADIIELRIAWKENLKHDLQEIFDDVGIIDDNSGCLEILATVRVNKSFSNTSLFLFVFS